MPVRVLAVALALSLGVNVWLLTARPGDHSQELPTIRASTVTVRTDAGVSRRADPVPRKADDEAAMRAMTDRIDALAAELAAAQEKAAEFDALDPLVVIQHSKKPLAWKLRRLLAIEPDKDRQMAAWKTGQVMGEREGSAAEILALLREEKDPKVLGVLAELMRAGAVGKAKPEERRAFAEILRTSPIPEVRLATVRGLFMSEAFRGGFDEKTKAVATEMNGYLIQAIREDASADVVGAIAQALSDWFPPPEALDALRGASERLPPGNGRRMVWHALGRGTFMGDSGDSLVRAFQAATAQDVRDDIASGIARAANSMGGGGAKDPAQARERFFTLYQGTSELKIRQDLARGAQYGFGLAQLYGAGRANAAAFYRDLIPLEPDAAQKDRLERMAKLLDSADAKGSQDLDKILYGRD